MSNPLSSDPIYPSVFSHATGDVTGDKTADNVYLLGIKTPDSPFVENITLLIQDGRTGSSQTISPPFNSGYNPTVFLGDFTGNGVDDILISIATGGSGGIMYYYIYSFLHNTPQMLFDFDIYNKHFNYQVVYKNNYQVEVSSLLNQTNYLIDISQRDSDYLNEIYQKDGTLIQPIEGFVDPLSGLYPVDFDQDSVYELLAYQKISGRYHADSLGYVQNVLSWKENGFSLDNQFVAIYGF